MKKASRLLRSLSLALAVLLLGGLIPAVSAAGESEREPYNVALGQSISATSSYIPPEGFFDAPFLVDGDWDTYPGKNGNVKLGWNTAVAGGPMKEDDPVDITLTLDDLYTISSVVVKPMQWNNGKGTPRDFEIRLSKNGTEWVTVAAAHDVDTSAKSNTAVKPLTFEFVPTDAQYVRIHVIRHSAVKDAGGCFISCLGELEVYGYISENASEGEVYMNKYALRMNPGETDWLYLTNGRKKTAHDVRYVSSDASVVTVDADGTVRSIACGEAVITLTDEMTGKTYDVPVTVDEFHVAEHFQIVAFIPLFYEKDINPTTFDNLKKGGITDVELNFALDAGTITYENNLKTIRYCYERGLDCTVSEADFNAGSWPGKTDEQILDFIKRYSHLPGVTAYYVVDEPANAVPFARPIALIKSIMPNAVAHMNFCGAYDGIVTPLQNELVKKYGQSLDYVMYDAYVFRSPVCAESTLYDQLAYNRTIGQRLGVKTATYIQSMAWNGCNRPNADAIRYQVYASLAAGVKQISYFCWQTPRANAAETYGPAVIDIDGNPTDLFEPVSKINAAVQMLGPTLMKLDTQAVYHTGDNFGTGYVQLPAGFFLHPVDWDQKLCFSYMTEQGTGRAYSMLVNRDYNAPAAVSFTADEGVRTLSYVSTETGRLCALTPENGVYTVTLDAGEGILLAADEQFVFKMENVTNYHYLEKAVADAGTLDLTKYREDGQDDFLGALEYAKQLLADKRAVQSVVDKAIGDLQRTQSALRMYAAEGVNIAAGKRVTGANTYEDGTYFSLAYLTDGVNADMTVTTHQGWSVDPYSAIKRNTAVDLVLDLERDYVIRTVVLRPCVYNAGGSTPSDFEIQVSSDKQTWTTVQKVADLKLEAALDQYYTIDPTEGRYVRIHITRHSETTDVGTGGALSQIGEIEVYGAEIGEVVTTAETAADPGQGTDPRTGDPVEPDVGTTDKPDGEKSAGTDPDTTAGTTSATADADIEKQSGCRSALGASALLALILSAGAAMIVSKRKKIF